MNVFTVMLNKPILHSVKRTGSYFTRQNPKGMIITVELKSDLSSLEMIDINSDNSNVFNNKEGASLDIVIKCEGRGSIPTGSYKIVSKSSLRIQVGAQMNHDRVCTISIEGTGLNSSNEDGEKVTMFVNTTKDFLQDAYSYSLVRSSVVNATVTRTGSKYTHQHGGELKVSFSTQNNVSEFEYINITGSQPMFKVDALNDSAKYINSSCTLQAGRGDKNISALSLTYARIYTSKFLSFRLSCKEVQSNLLNKSTTVNGTNKTSYVLTRGMSYCANAKPLIPALSQVYIVCPTTHLAVNSPSATVITLNIVTSIDFQPMITSIPFYRIIYEPYKVVLHSITRDKGSKYAGDINGDLVVRLSPLNKLVGNESDKIIIESKSYNIFIPPDSSSASNSSQNMNGYGSCTIEQIHTDKFGNKSLPNSLIHSRSLYDQSGRKLTILLTNSTETIKSLANLVVTCKILELSKIHVVTLVQQKLNLM